MKRTRFTRLTAALFVAALTTGACASTTAEQQSVRVESEASQTQEPATPVDSSAFGDVDLSRSVHESDVANARLSLEAAKATWAATALDSYELSIGLQSVSEVRVVVTDGSIVTEEIVRNDAGGGTSPDWAVAVPRTVDELFAEVEAMITPFEEDPSLAPPPGECGRHFHIQFDPTLGYPTLYDTLGPCADGVGIFAVVTPL